MDNQSPPLPPPPSPRPLRRHRHRGLRNLSIGFIVILILPLVLWLVFSKIETPTKNDATRKTHGNTYAPTQKSTQSALQSVAPEHNFTQSAPQSVAPVQKSTQRDTKSVAPEQNPAQNYIQSARKDTEHSLQSTKNDLKTKMGLVYERDRYYFLHDVNDNHTARNLSPPKQVLVDDKLTAEEVFAFRNKDVVQMPDRMFNLGGESCNGCLSEEALSESERLRYFGLVRIHLMVALTLYNNFCFAAGKEDGRPTGDKAEALSIIENQLKKLPREVLENAWDHQVKAIEAQIASYTIRGDLTYFGGAQWFCDRMNNDIERGHADPIFKTAREGFFPFDGN